VQFLQKKQSIWIYGPNLRAAGIDYDVRKAAPYSSYEDFEFNIPVGKSGDTYDRFCVRQYKFGKVSVL
jgi:NADH-quinone oxidoreductase subunit D